MIACADRRAEPSGDGRTLPGFRKKSFILNYAGGEIWFEHLDGIYGFTELAAEKLCSDSASFRRTSSPSHISFVLDETVVNDELISLIVDLLTKPGKRFMRIAFVGADRSVRRKLKKRLSGNDFAIGFSDRIDPAKEWLTNATL